MQKNQNNQQEPVINQDNASEHCNLCGKKSQFQCGQCFDVGYCKQQHQKADWPAHRPKCISLQQKIKIHNRQKYIMRAQIIQLLAYNQFIQASQVTFQLIDKQKRFNEKNKCLNNQIQYGATVMLLTRIWVYYKDFNKALEIMNGYLKTKMPFLSSTQNLQIPNEGGLVDIQQMKIIQNKLDLISSVASLSHQLVRNAMNIYEILINHIQVIYGSNSQQLGNIYFATANYLNFLNQPNKALACFLKAAKIRGNKCAKSYYNAGYICLHQKNYNYALDLLFMALNNLTQYEKSKNPQLQVSIYEALAIVYRNMNNYSKSVMSFQRALCMRQKSKDVSPLFMRKYLNVLNVLSTIKSQSGKVDSDIKMYSLPKQKIPVKKIIDLNKQQYNQIMQADQQFVSEQKQNQDWLESFNQFRKRLNVVSKIPQIPPVAYEKLIRKAKQQAPREQQIPNVIKNKQKTFIQQKLTVSLEFIQKLTASQMDFLNQLNRLLSQCKQKSALIDIFQNSNLFQTISKDKLDHFYRLNPKLQKDVRNIKLMDDVSEGNQSFSKQYVINQSPKRNKIVTPRLKLQNLPKHF